MDLGTWMRRQTGGSMLMSVTLSWKIDGAAFFGGIATGEISDVREEL
jgi:hypothetical protein